MKHPRQVLLGAEARTGLLPVRDHYNGLEARMRRSLAPQAQIREEFGACVFDVMPGCENGAPVGREAEHAAQVSRSRRWPACLIESIGDKLYEGRSRYPADRGDARTGARASSRS